MGKNEKKDPAIIIIDRGALCILFSIIHPVSNKMFTIFNFLFQIFVSIDNLLIWANFKIFWESGSSNFVAAPWSRKACKAIAF